MHKRTPLSHLVAMALSLMSNAAPLPRLPTEQAHTTTGRRDRRGKGRGRTGARKPFQHVRTPRPPAGKTARRRRRAANLRRG